MLAHELDPRAGVVELAGVGVQMQDAALRMIVADAGRVAQRTQLARLYCASFRICTVLRRVRPGRHS